MQHRAESTQPQRVGNVLATAGGQVNYDSVEAA
jgi:hypothetical protein